MKDKFIKVHWETEELDRHYRKNGHPEKVWKDNDCLLYTSDAADE